MERGIKEVFVDIWANISQNSAVIGLVILKIIVLTLGTLVCWWIFKKIFSKITPFLNNISFFRKNERATFILKKAGGYIILVGFGVIGLKIVQLPILEKFFYAGLTIGLASLLKQIVLLFLKYLQENIADKTSTKFDNIVIDLLKRFSGILIYAVAIIMALDMIGVNVMPFIAGAGFLSLAIGFAAKDTLSNLIAGVLLIIDRPFEVGDRIEVWTAPSNASTWGDVIDIGLRATKIRTTDNIIIIIPNNQIMTRDIINYTTISEEIRVRISVGIAYEADIGKARKVILDIVKQMNWISLYKVPKVVVRNLGDFCVELQARVWIKDARRRMDTVDFVVNHVKEAFQKNGIEIPYPKSEILIRKPNKMDPIVKTEKL